MRPDRAHAGRHGGSLVPELEGRIGRANALVFEGAQHAGVRQSARFASVELESPAMVAVVLSSQSSRPSDGQQGRWRSGT
ncbi:MAG: hypothetical protein P1P87_01525 [Trueperaceae bacterium]|nr:hypothetical protein [Trueperaceae bacterium]